MPPPAGQNARHPRPSYLAAPLLLSEAEPFEGAALLAEHPGALGVVLWKTLRDVSSWRAALPEERAELFPPAAAQARTAEVRDGVREPALWAPLLVVAEMLAEPVRADLRRIVNACRAVAGWGEEQGARAVQLAFTQAAALLVPEQPRLAYAVGRLARDRAEYARAESWLRCSIRLARRTDWHTYALAYLSLGTMYQMVGNLPAARSLALRGLRTARRRRLHALEGTAYHNLFVISAEMLDFRRAYEHAGAALDHYGANHPRVAALVNDIGCVWNMNGEFGDAVIVFDAVLPRFIVPSERMVVAANLARAAGGALRRDVFDRAWGEAERLLADSASGERSAEAWINLARGASSLNDHARVEAAAGRALELARAHRLAQVTFEAEALLAAARAGRSAAESAPRTGAGDGHLVQALALRVVRSLESAVGSR